MSMKIRNRQQMKAFPKHVQAQIEKKAPFALQNGRDGIYKTSNGDRYCPFPSPNPAVWLHNALVKEFGSAHLHADGQIGHEVIIAGSAKKFRFDHLHIPSRTAIEYDGWASHSKVDAFNRDREKDKLAMMNNFAVVRFTNRAVRENLDERIEELKSIIECRPKFKDKLEPFGKNYFKVIRQPQ